MCRRDGDTSQWGHWLRNQRARKSSLIASDGGGRAGCAHASHPAVYDELHRIAAQSSRRAGKTNNLASDGARPRAYLKMFGDTPLEWQNRAHFMASAAVMRQISSIRAREAPAQARCGRGRVPLDDDVVGGLSLDTSASTDRADDALVRLSARRTQVADREAPVLTNSRGDRQLLGRLRLVLRRRGWARDRNALPELGIMSAGRNSIACSCVPRSLAARATEISRRRVRDRYRIAARTEALLRCDDAGIWNVGLSAGVARRRGGNRCYRARRQLLHWCDRRRARARRHGRRIRARYAPDRPVAPAVLSWHRSDTSGVVRARRRLLAAQPPEYRRFTALKKVDA